MDFGLYDTEPRGWARNWGDNTQEEEDALKQSLSLSKHHRELSTIWCDEKQKAQLVSQPRDTIFAFGSYACGFAQTHFGLSAKTLVAKTLIPTLDLSGNRLEDHILNRGCSIHTVNTNSQNHPENSNSENSCVVVLCQFPTSETQKNTTATNSDNLTDSFCRGGGLGALEENLFVCHVMGQLNSARVVILCEGVGECGGNAVATRAWRKTEAVPVAFLKTPNVLSGTPAALLTQFEVHNKAALAITCDVSCVVYDKAPFVAWRDSLQAAGLGATADTSTFQKDCDHVVRVVHAHSQSTAPQKDLFV